MHRDDDSLMAPDLNVVWPEARVGFCPLLLPPMQTSVVDGWCANLLVLWSDPRR